MTITWSPERAGNWLFHCHFAFHLLPTAILEKASITALVPPANGHDQHVNHAMTAMSGLVMGIKVEPKRGRAFTDADPPRRRLRLVALSDSGFPDTAPSLRFRLEELRRGGQRKEARQGFSPTIELTRGEPVSIMVVNTMREQTAVHWHGIELAKDSADLPESQRVSKTARQVVSMGETYDYLYTPTTPGDFRIEIRAGPALLSRIPIRAR
jgi:hypothetical protein